MTMAMQDKPEKDDRAARLAAALRDNLRRRKAQARETEAAPLADSADSDRRE